MSDFYTEQLIKKKTTGKDIMIKVGMIALTVLSALVVFIFPMGIILPVALIVIDVFVFRGLNLEYEYLFVNGDLDIDKIMNKSKRKRVFSMNVADMEVLAPVNAGELMQFQRAKVSDYTSNTGNADVYAMVVLEKGVHRKILFEPNEEIVEGFYMMAPRKVVRKR